MEKRSRPVRMLLALATAALAAGCGSEGSGGTADPATSAQPSASASAGAGDGGTRAATVEAACPLLTADEVTATLGSSSGTKLESTEGPVDNSEGQPEYTCTYGRAGTPVLEFKVIVAPGRAGSGADVINAIADASGVETESVDGLGEASVAYSGDGVRLLATSLAYEQEQRTLIFASPAIVPTEKLAELATLVLARV